MSLHIAERCRGVRRAAPAAAAVAIGVAGGGVALAATTSTTSGAPGGAHAPPPSPRAKPPKARARFTRDQLVGRRVRARGTISPADPNRTVLMQVRVGRRWRTVDRARTRRGRFRASWRPRRVGRFRVRVVVRGVAAHAASRRARSTVRVYRLSFASWYGPGLIGGRTACGRTLTAGTLGVAHRWLPCGTKVTLRYRGRRVRVPVIDRGPYAAGRTWDLTPATKARLRFPSTGALWSTR